MKFAFCLYKYFPYGGLQRDFLRIAQCCQEAGCQIRVYTLLWNGDVPPGFDVITVPVQALTNHSRYERFSEWVGEALITDPVDCVIGINKMPGLDVYYAADSCYEEKARSQRNWLYRQLPRYRHFAAYEKAVFAPDSNTEILMISQAQRPFFIKHHDTPLSRMHFLPPGIAKDRVAPHNADEIRSTKRAELGLADDEHMLLMVGSGFIKKGLKRALLAVRSLPRPVRERVRFLVMGEDNPRPFRRMIFRMGLRRNVEIMSGQDDIPGYLLAADLLLHPALDEAAGIILLEAVVAGLPVLATDICGYGHYVEEADVGELVPSPFDQKDLNARLLAMLHSERQQEWRANGRRFAARADIYTLPQEASRIIQAVSARKVNNRSDKELAFCLYKYFPFGGSQRDFLRIARECQDRGYRIRVYTLSWQGEVPAGFNVVLVPVNAVTNHKRYERFSDWVQDDLGRNPVTGVIGFNKMPDLDIYYAADPCYEEKAQTQRGHLYRTIPRYRHFSNFEKAVFDPDARTQILMISDVQKPLFLKHYNTPLDRFHELPPGISRDRIRPPEAEEVRAGFRAEYGLAEDDLLLLLVGSGFITKGLDRVLKGMTALPPGLLERTHLIVVGQDNPVPFERQARRLGVSNRVRILRGRDDVPRFLLGADLLVLPAYSENTGTVILEAIVSGLPVLVTDVCGYAHYVAEADAGCIVDSPFSQKIYNATLTRMLSCDEHPRWRENGLAFAANADIYSMPQRAADYIARMIR